ncbi:unnamed protein product [Bursaphelenchus xylophilus]|uniref:Integral membrane protein 2 n=1 Tax=Bursaphelenchus xylophilus TaxID=6326 RepID=A0A1I7SLE4_BURXY|nr:unnamed protein product [Bursaphelenchus xylophilus]CAG9129532.1 unnamed protein product [Bursaphelenchus xylophilus]
MPNDKTPSSPPRSPGIPVVVSIEEKNKQADASNPVLSSLPQKYIPSTPTTMPLPPPPAYSERDREQGFIGRMKRKVRRNAKLNEERISAICVPIFLTWLLVASFFAGLLFYRYFGHRAAESTFYRWCGTDYLDSDMEEPQRLEQKLEINQEELYERIQVPKFGINRPAVFVHDFRKNITAIVDILGERCFLKDLDRSLVAPPKNFIDLIQKMEKGYYAQNPRVIRETYRVGDRLNPLELKGLGSAMVSKHCQGKEVFRLEKVAPTPDERFYGQRRRRDAPNSLNFAVLTGENVELENIIL